MEAIADLLSIARLPPGHDLGAGYGVATAARQRWHLKITYFGLFGGPVAASNDERSGSGGDAVEAIADLSSIATLPPGHDPGADCGVATLSGSGGTWPLDNLVCSAARWPPQTTSARANGRTIPAHEQAAETALPGHGPAPPGHGPADHGDHGDHDRPRRSRPMAGCGSHGRSRRSRPTTAECFGRGHGGRRERSTGERHCRTTHTGERTSERTDRTAGSAGDTAPGIRPRGRRGGRTDRTAGSAGDTAPVTAVTASQGRMFRLGVTTPR